MRGRRVPDRLQEAKARQVYLVLRDRIVSGAVHFGARLPNENALALAHGVSRVTIRRALGELQREHLIERRRSAQLRPSRLQGEALRGPGDERQNLIEKEMPDGGGGGAGGRHAANHPVRRFDVERDEPRKAERVAIAFAGDGRHLYAASGDAGVVIVAYERVGP